MTDKQHPVQLIKRILEITENAIISKTQAGVSSGSKVFGAAILSKQDLSALTVSTNNERASPLLHGEINCIQEFFASPTVPTGDKSSTVPRPPTSDTVFFATHEPCSLCLSGITWSGFNEFYFLFTYEDSRDRFAIPHDINILQEVFRVRAPSDTDDTLNARPLYNKCNKFFNAKSVADLLEDIQDLHERAKWASEIQRVKSLYDKLSETYQTGKQSGHETSSVWK